MGQSHNFFSCCSQMASGKEKYSNSGSKFPPSGLLAHRRESGNDSGHSSAESISPNRDSRTQRCSQSSESSGKFSFRGSISSPAESEIQNKNSIRSSLQAPEDLPVFCEEGDIEGTVPPSENLIQKRRRSSLSSVSYLGAILFRTKGSSSGRRWSRSLEEEPKESRPRRAVSLRLPRSRHPKDIDTKVPTVYVDDEELSSGRGRRKSSLRRALSLLSLNSLTKEVISNSSTGSSRPPKPVQKILRHPTKRHTTVRGISGLAIDGRSQAPYRGGLQRAQTLVYYPTNTSLRTALRPTYSNAIYT